jgi:hypothetical protein
MSISTPTTRFIVKVQYCDQIRRISTIAPSWSFEEVRAYILEHVLRLGVDSHDVTVKFKDCEGDIITINSSAELQLAKDDAKQQRRTLKLRILGPNNESNGRSIEGREAQSYSDSDTAMAYSAKTSDLLWILRELKNSAGSNPAPTKVKARGCRGSGKSKRQQGGL